MTRRYRNPREPTSHAYTVEDLQTARRRSWDHDRPPSPGEELFAEIQEHEELYGQGEIEAEEPWEEEELEGTGEFEGLFDSYDNPRRYKTLITDIGSFSGSHAKPSHPFHLAVRQELNAPRNFRDKPILEQLDKALTILSQNAFYGIDHFKRTLRPHVSQAVRGQPLFTWFNEETVRKAFEEVQEQERKAREAEEFESEFGYHFPRGKTREQLLEWQEREKAIRERDEDREERWESYWDQNPRRNGSHYTWHHKLAAGDSKKAQDYLEMDYHARRGASYYHPAPWLEEDDPHWDSTRMKDPEDMGLLPQDWASPVTEEERLGGWERPTPASDYIQHTQRSGEKSWLYAVPGDPKFPVASGGIDLPWYTPEERQQIYRGKWTPKKNPRPYRRNFFWGGSEKTERTVEKEAEGLLRERYGQPWYDLGLPRNWFYSYKLWDREAKDLNESQLQQMYANIDARIAEEKAERAQWEVESKRRAAEQKIRDVAELAAARAARSAEEVAADEAFDASMVGKPASYTYKARGDRRRRLGRKWNPKGTFSAGEPYSDQDGREIFPVYKGTTLFKKYYKAENRDRWLARRARDK